MVRLFSAIAQQKKKSGDLSTQYVDISISGRPARAIVESGAKENIMNKTTIERLRLNYVPSHTCVKTVNAPLTPVCGVAQGVSIMLRKL